MDRAKPEVTTENSHTIAGDNAQDASVKGQMGENTRTGQSIIRIMFEG